MSLKAVDITADSNHTDAEYLYGISARGTFTARLRLNSVSGQILYNITDATDIIFPMAFRCDGGTYVEVASGTITEGVLIYQ